MRSKDGGALAQRSHAMLPSTDVSSVETAQNIAYLSDVEGRWDKLTSFVKDNPFVFFDALGRLRVRDNALFVFGGDAVDRGPDSQRVVSTLLECKRAQPSRVVLLAGNRDINKLRLARELAGRPLARTPDAERAAGGPALLRWILANTMGAKDAFEHRRTELARTSGSRVSDEAVYESFRNDIAPGGALRAFLCECMLAFRTGDALFVHGGVCEQSFGVVPTHVIGEDELRLEYRKITDDSNTWVDALNQFYRRQIAAFDAEAESAPLDRPAPWAALIAYQAPLPGSKANQRSVVYGRTTDRCGNPQLPERSVIDRLRRDGIYRVFVGHSPAGDCPSVLRFEDFSMVFADNSYGRIERGSHVLLFGERTVARGTCKLDDGATIETFAEWTRATPPPLGARTRAERALVKAQSADGRWVLYRALEGYRQEQRVCEPSQLGAVEPALDESSV
jgi:hypothetical protein